MIFKELINLLIIFSSIPIFVDSYQFSNRYLTKLNSKIFLEDYNDSDNFNNDLITLSPAGLQGFYTLGISAYIKENYNLDDYLFSGASAGAWNALYMTYKGDSWDIPKEISKLCFQNITSVFDLETKIKEKLSASFSSNDFDFNKLFIGVTTLQNCKFKTTIYNQFTDLNDALDCCVASSHIPFITGGFLNRYHNITSFDGGFKKYPYLTGKESIIHINPDMWRKKNGYIVKKKNNIDFVNFFNSLIIKEHTNFKDLFYHGYHDAKDNQDILNHILSKTNT